MGHFDATFHKYIVRGMFCGNQEEHCDSFEEAVEHAQARTKATKYKSRIYLQIELGCIDFEDGLATSYRSIDSKR